MVNEYIKFEFLSSTHYEDRKCDAKRYKTGWFGVVMGHSR